GETSQIYFNRYLADSGWSGPQLLATGYYPALAVSSNGSATAIWFAADNNLVAAVFSPATGWTNSSSIDANNNNVGYHRIAINDFGDAFAIWSQSDGSLDSIWSNHYVSGEGWKGAKLVENRNLYGAYRPVIVIN